MNMSGQLRVAFLGCGAAGSAITEMASIMGFDRTMIVNSSKEDLSAIQSINPANKFQLGSNIHGAAKNRDAAFSALKDTTIRESLLTGIQSALTVENTSIDEYDVFFVVSSAGGGTGSGIAPAVSRILRLTYPSIYIVPIIVLPAMYERGIAQQNAIDCLREFKPTTKEKEKGDWRDFTIMLVDNGRNDTDLLQEKFDEINKSIISNISRLTKCEKTSRIGNIDVADRKSMFSDPGIMVIGSSEIVPEEASPIREALKRAINATPMAADVTASVKRVAIQCETSVSLYTQKNITEAQSVFKNVAGIFEGYYGPDKPDVDGKTPNGKLLVAFSGGRLPETLIRERESIIDATFKTPQEAAVELSKGNSELKSAWGESTAKAKTPVDNASIVDMFNDLEETRA